MAKMSAAASFALQLRTKDICAPTPPSCTILAKLPSIGQDIFVSPSPVHSHPIQTLREAESFVVGGWAYLVMALMPK